MSEAEVDAAGGELTEDELEIELVDEGGAGARRRFVLGRELREMILAAAERGDLTTTRQLVGQSPATVADRLADRADRQPEPVRVALAEAFVGNGDLERAARVAATIEDPGKAAPFFERVGQLARAADLYDAAGRPELAAALHERDLHPERAVAVLTSAGLIDRAAAVLESTGRFTEAARLWARMQRLDRATDMLFKVERDQPDFPEATLMLGRIFEHQGQMQAAAVRYLEVVKNHPLSGSTLPIFERLAGFYLTTGDARSARRLLTVIVGFAPAHDGALAMLAQLDAPPLASPAAPASAPASYPAVAMSQAIPVIGAPPRAAAGPARPAPLVLPRPVSGPAPAAEPAAAVAAAAAVPTVPAVPALRLAPARWWRRCPRRFRPRWWWRRPRCRRPRPGCHRRRWCRPPSPSPACVPGWATPSSAPPSTRRH